MFDETSTVPAMLLHCYTTCSHPILQSARLKETITPPFLYILRSAIYSMSSRNELSSPRLPHSIRLASPAAATHAVRSAEMPPGASRLGLQGRPSRSRTPAGCVLPFFSAKEKQETTYVVRKSPSSGGKAWQDATTSRGCNNSQKMHLGTLATLGYYEKHMLPL